MTQILIPFSNVDKIYIFGQNFTTNMLFTILLPVKNVFLGSCHNFQKIFIFLHNSVAQKKIAQSISKRSDVGQLSKNR